MVSGKGGTGRGQGGDTKGISCQHRQSPQSYSDTLGVNMFIAPLLWGKTMFANLVTIFCIVFSVQCMSVGENGRYSDISVIIDKNVDNCNSTIENAEVKSIYIFYVFVIVYKWYLKHNIYSYHIIYNWINQMWKLLKYFDTGCPRTKWFFSRITHLYLNLETYTFLIDNFDRDVH